ncbi:hypothetical protein BGX38DRAFT_1079195, partial [Terfezia claveryi]
PLDKFFATYPDFRYNPAALCRSEFKRLCTHRGWKTGKRRFRKARMAFARAAGEELLSRLERNRTMFSGDSLPWRRLCRILDLRMGNGLRPQSKTQCKKVLNRTFINIYDFVDHLNDQMELEIFQSLKALANYSYAEDKVYPKAAAKGNELLNFLLHQISSA